jgi:hypothetical protein
MDTQTLVLAYTVNFSSCYMPLGQHSTAFDGEIEAVSTALRLLDLHQTNLKELLFSLTQRLQYYLRGQQKL